MKLSVWKILRFVYLFFVCLVLIVAFVYGVPMYRYLKKPVEPATNAPFLPDSIPGGAAGHISGSNAPVMTSATLLQADAAMLPKFKEAVDKVAPHSAKAYTGLGILHQMKGLRRESIGLYEKAIQLDSSFPDARYRLGTVYHEAGDLDAALRYYQEAVTVKPDYLYGYYGMGAIYQKKNRLEEAQNAFHKILSLKADEYQALNNLGIIYEELGNPEKALGAYQAAAAANPKDALVQENLRQAQSAYPDVKPAAPEIPREKPAPPAPAAKPVKKAPFKPKETHSVYLRNKQTLSGVIEEKSEKGFWLLIDHGTRVFVDQSEVIRLEKD